MAEEGFYIGDALDRQILEDIQEQLARKNISSQVQMRLLQQEGVEVFSLWVNRIEDVPLAQEYYQLALGHTRRRDIPTEVRQMQQVPLGFVTKLLLGIASAVFVLKYFFPQEELVGTLLISEDKIFGAFLPEVRRGEVWRLWTGIFLHFGFFHLLFNMLWLKDLGKMVEQERGGYFLLGLVAVLAVISNVAQYVVHGPYFGGMSGVVYGFLGYVWMNKTFHPSAPFALPAMDIKMMIMWFLLCAFGAIAPIANTAHGVGLSVGMWVGMGLNLNRWRDWPLAKWCRFFILAAGFSLLTISIEYYKLGGKFFIS